MNDRSYIIGKITHYEEGQAGATFNGWDSEKDMIIKVYVLMSTDSNQKVIRWREITNIEEI